MHIHKYVSWMHSFRKVKTFYIFYIIHLFVYINILIYFIRWLIDWLIDFRHKIVALHNMALVTIGFRNT